MQFIDEIEIIVRGGNGGAGSIHWRRESFVPAGGPDGGRGGDGGAVLFETDSGLNTLIDFAFRREIVAGNGGAGEGNLSSGARGKDERCRVPVGTQVYFGERLVADLDKPGQLWVAARGGRGGRGNASYKTSTRQAPDFAETGEQGENFQLRLVLKSVADVGLVGLPNVGKSTFLAACTKAQPRVADYPFTTLQPELGVLIFPDERRLVIADIPGLIEGAHTGKGLGLTFLRHIERTSVLLQLIDPILDLDVSVVEDEQLGIQTIAQFETIDAELRAFSSVLAERPRVVGLTKADLGFAERAKKATEAYFERRAIPCFALSSQSKHGLDELQDELYRLSRAPA